MARLMILGGGSSQIPAIKRAKEKGFTVILTDANPNAPGRSLAQEFVPVSTFDPLGITEAAAQLGVQALFTLGSDQPVYTAAYAAAQLELPNPLTPEQALNVTNKAPMKELFQVHHIPTADFRILSSSSDVPELESLALPWVLKPVDSQGQRGIYLIRDPGELKSLIPQSLAYSRDGRLVLESYYPSQEVTFSGWAGPDSTNRSDTQLWTISDRITFDPEKWPQAGLGVCLAHRYPSQFALGQEEEILALARRIVGAFELENTPLYFQFLLGRQGIKVNEIACRLGGAYEDQWIPLVRGIDILDHTLDWYAEALGLPSGSLGPAGPTGYSGPTGTDDPTYPSAPASDRGAASPTGPDGAAGRCGPSRQKSDQHPIPRASHCVVPLLFAKPGRVEVYGGTEELQIQTGVQSAQFLLPPGTDIGPMKNSTQRVGYAILSGPTPQGVNELVHRTFDILRVENSAGENLLYDTRVESLFPDGVQ